MAQPEKAKTTWGPHFLSFPGALHCLACNRLIQTNKQTNKQTNRLRAVGSRSCPNHIGFLQLALKKEGDRPSWPRPHRPPFVGCRFIALHRCCVLLFFVCFGFVYKWKARPSTGIKMTTHFLVMPALSRRSGTGPEVPLRYVCVPTSGSCQPQAHSPCHPDFAGTGVGLFPSLRGTPVSFQPLFHVGQVWGPASGASWHPLCPGELSAEFISVARFPFGRWIQIEMRSKSICSHVLSANQTQGGL